jgi:hypothetical protein
MGFSGFDDAATEPPMIEVTPEYLKSESGPTANRRGVSVGTVCADVPVLMDKEISGRLDRRSGRAYPSISKGRTQEQCRMNR